MRAALRLADARLAHPEPSNRLHLYLPTPVATDRASDIPPTNEGAGASPGALASLAICDSTR
eukprot:1733970-Alexandrium_andersonii.AAC.1